MQPAHEIFRASLIIRANNYSCLVSLRSDDGENVETAPSQNKNGWLLRRILMVMLFQKLARGIRKTD